TGWQELLSDATLIAKAGGSTAVGGSLVVKTGLSTPTGITAVSPLLPTLELTPQGSVLPVSFSAPGQTSAGQQVLDKTGHVVSVVTDSSLNYYGGRVSTTTFASGGFDWLEFDGNVRYSGAVSLKAGSGITMSGASSAGTAGASVTGGLLFADQ